jgi:hypothetical protein
MALNPTQQEIAQIVNYTPVAPEEEFETFDVDINFVQDGKSVPFNGAVAIVDGVKQLFWMPQCSSYRNEYDDLVGWYELPTLGDMEEYTFDSVCPTPAGDEFEPDHPDTWLSLLGMV